MIGVRPCPYCGGEVEVIKLAKTKKDKKQPYRIECRKCRALVARGEGFPIETPAEAELRIKQYKKIIEKQMAPTGIKRTRPSKFSNDTREFYME